MWRAARIPSIQANCQIRSANASRPIANLVLFQSMSILSQKRGLTGGTILYAIEQVSRELVSFDAANPTTFLSCIPLTGIDPATNEYIDGIDFRPSDGRLYGFLTRGFPGRARVVSIDTTTGQVTPVHPTNTVAALADLFRGFDIQPSADFSRSVGRERANRRLSLTNGTLLSTDLPLTYVGGDANAGATPRIVHSAQTIMPGSSASTLFALDSETNSLVRIGGVNGDPSPNDGGLTTIGPLGFDFTNFGGMDIAPGSSFAYAALNINSIPHLVQVDLATGAGTIVGPIGSGDRAIDGLTMPVGPLVLPTPTPTPTPTPVPSPSPTASPSPSPTPIPENAAIIRPIPVASMPGSSVTVQFEMVARGGEKSASFTVNYNSAVLSNPVPELFQNGTGGDLTTDVSQVASGRLGVRVELPTPVPAGIRRFLIITFNVAPASPPGVFPISFGNTPVPLEIRDANGIPVVSAFQAAPVVLILTAAGVDVSGRVLTADGRGLRNARVVMTDAGGSRRVVTTSSFGHYRFTDIEAGGSYVISISSNRYTFASRLVQVVDTLGDVDFVAN